MDQALEQYIDANSRLLGLAIEPEWREAVKGHLAVILEYADLVAQHELSEDCEPAPMFKVSDREK